MLIPMYNVAPYLRECLDSLLAQWQAGVEVVLLDDASTDTTAALAATLCAQHPGKLRLLRHAHNTGIAAARNTLLQAAQGEFVWFLDSDDKLLPGALARLRTCLAQHDPDLVLCDFRTFREGGRLKDRLRDRRRKSSFSGPAHRAGTDRQALLRHVLQAGQLHPWSKIARRTTWTRVLFPEGRTFEDIATIMPLLHGVRRWVHIPEAWVGYRVRADSIVHAPSGRSMADLVLSLRDLHAAVVREPDCRADRALCTALDRFCLHRLSAAALWCCRTGQAVPLDMPALLRGMYPQGAAGALDRVGRWGWLRRARKVRYRIRRAGWLDGATG
ncbi:MAG: glycosyltransferase family 2 protein [Pseudoxanthomonas suwonensis]|nr:glycosyltransferase family 2 protein [Pseudoxanthomonas suwonensis]